MDFHNAHKAIERAPNIEALTSLLFDRRGDSALSHLIYHAVEIPASGKSNPLLLLTYDDAWVNHYVEQDYFRIDPVVLAGRKGFLPVDWMTVDHHTKEARHFFAEAESRGVGRHGFTLPIRGPAGERALFTITTNDNDEHWYRWRYSHLQDFHLLAHYFHDRAVRLAGLRHENVMRPLAPREKQCLEHLIQGQAQARSPQPWICLKVQCTHICVPHGSSWIAPRSSRLSPKQFASRFLNKYRSSTNNCN